MHLSIKYNAFRVSISTGCVAAMFLLSRLKNDPTVSIMLLVVSSDEDLIGCNFRIGTFLKSRTMLNRVQCTLL